MSEVKHETTKVRCKNSTCENGVIIKKTRIRLAIPKNSVRFVGGPPSMESTVTCYCNSCGTMYEPDVVLR